MAEEIRTTAEGMLLNWLKSEGEAVSKGDIIAEFEADKATVEVESPADGVVLELLVAVGEEVEEDIVIARIGEEGESAAGDGADAAAEAQEKQAQSQAKANGASTLQKQTASSGGAARTPDGRIKVSPLARRIAQDRGVDLAQIAGSGPGGRIVKEDVENFDPSTAPQPQVAATGEVAAGPLPQSYGKLPEGDDVEIIDLNRMRKAIAKGTVRSVQTTPHFYVTIEVDVAQMLTLRQELNEELAAEGVKISVNDMIVKAAALTLRKFPNLNTHYYGDQYVRHQHINVAIAVALEESDGQNGLVNVVSPDTDKTALGELAQYHRQLFDEVRSGNIRQEYVQGGTFLVSNLGAYNVEQFSSIIDPPQSGALAVGSARKVPIVKDDGSLGIGTRMKVTLSIDHRVSDGAEGAQWLDYFRSLIENPIRLLV